MMLWFLLVTLGNPVFYNRIQLQSCYTTKKDMYLQILLFYVTRVPLPFHKSYLLKSAPIINASFYPSLKYHKHSCISRTFLLKFWAKNRRCGLCTRPLLSEGVKGLVGVINWTENLQWIKIKHILKHFVNHSFQYMVHALLSSTVHEFNLHVLY